MMEITEAYQRYYGLVVRQAQRVLGDEEAARDVAHDVFIKLMQVRETEIERNTHALLFRMATNAAINRLVVLRRSVTLTEQHVPSGAQQQREDALALRKVLALSRPQEAQVAVYYYLCGMDQEEIAELLKINRRQVGRFLERFRDRAKKLLGSVKGELAHAL